MSKAKPSAARGRAAKSQADHNERLLKSLGIAPVTVLHRDTDLRVTWAYNPQPNISVPELLGRTLEEAYPANHAAALRQFYRPVLEKGETAHAVMELNTLRNKSPRLFDMFAQPLRDEQGNIKGASCTAYDVTSIVATQRQLNARKAQLRLALEAANMGEWRYEVATSKLYHSPSYSRLYGMPEQESPISPEVFAKRLGPGDKEVIHNRFIDAIANNETIVRQEFRIFWPDGTERWISSRGQVQYEQGQPVRIIGIDMDITDDRRALRLLEQANQELEQFAFTASHDLKEPVRTISSFATLLERQLQTALDSKARNYINLIRHGTQQMERLINGLLELARTSYAELVWEEVDLQNVLAEVLALLDSAIRETGSSISSDPLPKVRGNHLMLSNTLQNLLSNAIKFRQPERPARIHVSAHRHGQKWQISVEDEGLGIAEEIRNRIFDPFQRQGRDQQLPGSGLGLALCKRVVERHGGSIWMEARPQGGSIFLFTLPAPSAESDRAEA